MICCLSEMEHGKLGKIEMQNCIRKSVRSDFLFSEICNLCDYKGQNLVGVRQRFYTMIYRRVFAPQAGKDLPSLFFLI